jgi:hypothetical protein
MLPFGVTIPATVPQGLEIPEGLMNNPVYPPLYSADDEISTSNHSPYISLYIASICKPEDGL